MGKLKNKNTSKNDHQLREKSREEKGVNLQV